ncbi:MAG: hypothetical protein LBO04_00750 [Spirochaetaceae bacterium]|nr:hypothetical protein [Spirochaetaceae bacterium]
MPVLITDVDNFSLPRYSPPNSHPSGGTSSMRINPEELNIKRAYTTSDGITHIILGGNIDNGIPEGLLWSEQVVGGAGPAGTYGYFSESGTYGGYGDIKIGSLSGTVAGTHTMAIGSPDFSAEWAQANFYSAVVIKGLVEDDAEVTITETNDSLRLYSTSVYLKNGIRDGKIDFDGNGRIYQTVTYSKSGQKPNNYSSKKTGDIIGYPRGGYMLLFSKNATPPTATVEVAYKDGTKKIYNIDYSAVGFNLDNEVPLTDIRFEEPPVAAAGTYGIGSGIVDSNQSDIMRYEISGGTVGFGNISVGTDGSPPLKPLYIRPVYTPAKVKPNDTMDPRGNTTNMIHRIWFDLLDDQGGAHPYGKNNFNLTWNDDTQAITLYVKEGAQPFDPAIYDSAMAVTIHAELRNPYVPTPPGSGDPIREFAFDFKITTP